MADLTPLWRTVMQWVDQRIAERLREIGVVGGTIDGGHVGGQLPPATLPSHEHEVTTIQGRPVSDTAPQIGDAYVWDGSAWVPTQVNVGGGVGRESIYFEGESLLLDGDVLTIGVS